MGVATVSTMLVPPMPHPWRAIREMEDWQVRFGDLPASTLGTCEWSTKTITLRKGMSQRVRRSVLTHEWRHAVRGPFSPAVEVAEEIECDYEAAFWLIDYPHLLHALQWTRQVDELAEELWTSRHLTLVRLRNLHIAERGNLARELGPDWKRSIR